MAGRKAVLRMAIRAFDLPGLHEALFESGGLHDDTWDIAFLSTDSTSAEHGASSTGHRVAAGLDELIVDAIRTDIAEMGLRERAEKKIAVV